MACALMAVAIATLLFVSTMMYNQACCDALAPALESQHADEGRAFTQVYAIVTGIGTIDRMRKRGPKGNFAPVPWVDVFGVDPLPMWFLPTDVKYRDFHRVMGCVSSWGASVSMLSSSNSLTRTRACRYKVATWEIAPGPQIGALDPLPLKTGSGPAQV